MSLPYILHKSKHRDIPGLQKDSGILWKQKGEGTVDTEKYGHNAPHDDILLYLKPFAFITNPKAAEKRGTGIHKKKSYRSRAHKSSMPVF